MSPDPVARREGGAPWDDLVIVAEAARAHGVRGELLVRGTYGDATLLVDSPSLYVGRGPDDVRPVGVASCRRTHGGVILRLEGVETRDAAAALAGSYLLLPREAAPPLPAGRAYTFQLPGLRVESPQGDDLGRIVDVEECPAHDVWVARCEAGEYRIPAIDNIVLLVDLPGGRVVIDPIRGLLPTEPTQGVDAPRRKGTEEGR